MEGKAGGQRVGYVKFYMGRRLVEKRWVKLKNKGVNLMYNNDYEEWLYGESYDKHSRK